MKNPVNRIIILALVVVGLLVYYHSFVHEKRLSDPIVPESASPPTSSVETEESLTPPTVVETDLEGELLTVHYLDVGQADSAFIELPSGENILIDAGNRGDGELIVDYISGLGYDTITYAIGTHPHEDHIGGFPDVFSYFDVLSIYIPDVEASTKIYQTFMSSIENEGITPTYVLEPFALLDSNDIKIDMISPNNKTYAEYKSSADLNVLSIYTRIEYGSTSFLFTGDGTIESESLVSGNIQSDVLKVPHHGSLSSSSLSFIKAVNPVIAIISCGLNNEYGHPHSEVWQRITENVPRVYRTDEDGTIVVISNGSELSLYQESGHMGIA